MGSTAQSFTSGGGVGGDPRPRLAATVGPLVEGKVEIREALARLAAIGYAGVQWPATTAGLRPRDLDASARRSVRDFCRRHELVVAGVDAWIPPRHFLDRQRVDRAVAAVEEAIRFAAECATPERSRPVVAIQLPEGEEVESALADAVAAMAAIAERQGVFLADHAVKRRPFAGIGIGIDPAALLGAGRDPIAALAEAGTLLAAARLVDLLRSGLRGPIGEPSEWRLDLLAYRVSLEIAPPPGLITADARQWRDPLAGLEATLARWRGEGHLTGPSGTEAGRREPKGEA